MKISLMLAGQIFSMFLMGLTGYVLRKANMITKEQCKGISVFCLYACNTCVLFMAFQTSISQEKITGFIYSMLAVLIVHVLYFIAMAVIRKIYPLNAVEYTSIIYSNCGNMIVPLVTGIFGAEYVFYTSAYLFYQSILLWSHAVMSVCGAKFNWKKLLLNPCILAIFLGMIFLAFGWMVPDVVATAANNLGGCLGPTAMMVIGINIADVDLKKLFSNRRIYVVLVLRLIIYPIICMVGASIVYRFFPGTDPAVYLIIVMASAAPAPTMITQLSQLYGKDSGYASSINVFSTLLALVTMPIMIGLAQLFV